MDRVRTLIGQANANIQDLKSQNRLLLIRHWVKEGLIAHLHDAVVLGDKRREALAILHDHVDQRVPPDAEVIGLTTTGLARNIKLLRKIQYKVMICEEACNLRVAYTVKALAIARAHYCHRRPPATTTADL